MAKKHCFTFIEHVPFFIGCHSSPLVGPLKYQIKEESNINLADFQALIFRIWHGTLIWEGQSRNNWYWFDFAKTWSSSLTGVKSQATCSEGAKTAATSFQSLGLFLQTLLAMDTFLGQLGKNASQCPWNLKLSYFTFMSFNVYDGVPLRLFRCLHKLIFFHGALFFGMGRF